jgi:hypothetical protein
VVVGGVIRDRLGCGSGTCTGEVVALGSSFTCTFAVYSLILHFMIIQLLPRLFTLSFSLFLLTIIREFMSLTPKSQVNEFIKSIASVFLKFTLHDFDTNNWVDYNTDKQGSKPIHFFYLKKKKKK